MLRALDLTKSYDGAPLFEGLSLTLNAGDRAGLVGPNGAGKSTLLGLLAGREQPDRGSVTRQATVGYLPQEAPDATLDQLLQAAAAHAQGRVVRHAQRPGAGQAHRARFLTASTSEVYGDPQVHPQPESYWGHVEPDRPARRATTRPSATPRR